MHTLIIATPLGAALKIVRDEMGIVDSRFVAAQAPAKRAGDALLREAAAQTRAYFARRLKRFDLPFSLCGTRLQVEVWRLVAKLEFGQIVSYADAARAIGRPLAHRGVAAALGKTPLALYVPAHRVIGADGKIKGAASRSMRHRLLEFEGHAGYRRL